MSQLQSVRSILTGLIDAKITEYGGVTMRSRLEADFARLLDRRGFVWHYEPAIFGPRGRGYLPDFEIFRPDGRHFVEVKPTVRQVARAQERMEIIWETLPDAVLIVVCAQGSRWYGRQPGGTWETWVDRWAHA